MARPVAPPNETKADRFRRLGHLRVNQALEALDRIGALSGKSYEYTPEQVHLIDVHLCAKLEAVLVKFSPKKESQEGFSGL